MKFGIKSVAAALLAGLVFWPVAVKKKRARF